MGSAWEWVLFLDEQPVFYSTRLEIEGQSLEK
jgi:hypothetical protein